VSAPPERRAENELQHQLRDLICLAVVGDHVRWVSADDELGDWLVEATGTWRTWADRVATQLRASGVAPDGRVRSLVKDIALNWVPGGWLSAEEAQRLIVQRLAVVAEWARYRTRALTAATPTCSLPSRPVSRRSCALAADRRCRREIRTDERRQLARAASSPTIAP